MTIRTLTIKDYPNVIEFWKNNYLLTPLDEFDRVNLFLEKNKNLSLLAEQDGEIVGTILVSFDGRRGGFQKLVVKKDQRGNGIGKKLVKEAVKNIENLDGLEIRFNSSEELSSFYEKCGFKKDRRPTMVMKKFKV